MGPPGAIARAVAAIGRPVVAGSRAAAAVLVMLGRALALIAAGRVDRREVWRQLYAIGNRSLVFIAVTIGFLGLISVYLVGTQLERILPEFSVIGPAYIQLMVREFGPALTGLMVATRVGTGIAAEIGSMVVTDQVDALRMCNADPVRYLVAPRLLASTLMMVVLSTVAVVVAVAAGIVMGRMRFGIPPETFLNLVLTEPADLVIGLTKCVLNGLAVPVIAAWCGLQAHGGSEGVGRATTAAVVSSSFAVIVIDLVVGGVGYVVG